MLTRNIQNNYVTEQLSFFYNHNQRTLKKNHFRVYITHHLTAVIKEDLIRKVLPDRLNAQQTK